MKTRIEIKDWKKDFRVRNEDGKNVTWKNKITGAVIFEYYSNDEGCFLYFNEDHKYIGRYNSDTSLFTDGLILIVLDSEY